MAPILKKGLFCCISLRTCALILGTITLVCNLLTLSMFIVSLNIWLSSLSESDHDHWNHWNHTDVAEDLEHLEMDHLHPDIVANISAALGGVLSGADHGDLGDLGHHAGDAAHPFHPDKDDYGINDSEAMEASLEFSPRLVLALVWFDFILVLLETLAVIMLIWGAAKRRAEFLLPWLGVELFTTLYDLGFFVYMAFFNDVLIAVDLVPIILLPITVYCWLVVYSLYQECRETASRNAAIPLSMSALEAGGAGGAGGGCTVPYGRMAA